MTSCANIHDAPAIWFMFMGWVSGMGIMHLYYQWFVRRKIGK